MGLPGLPAHGRDDGLGPRRRGRPNSNGIEISAHALAFGRRMCVKAGIGSAVIVRDAGVLKCGAMKSHSTMLAIFERAVMGEMLKCRELICWLVYARLVGLKPNYSGCEDEKSNYSVQLLI